MFKTQRGGIFNISQQFMVVQHTNDKSKTILRELTNLANIFLNTSLPNYYAPETIIAIFLLCAQHYVLSIVVAAVIVSVCL